MLASLLIVVALVLLNGLFALAELAVVSSRRARLAALADRGRAGAQSAMALHANPGRFLSAVQIGITLVGVVNGAFSAETFGEAASGALMAMGMAEASAATLGFGAVIIVVTYLSVIIGELVPKTLALRNPEAIACLVAPTMTLFARLAGPAVWLLDASTRLVMRLIGRAGEAGEEVTDEEIRSLVAQAEKAGVVEREESAMIAGVMRLADRNAASLMTPRNDVDWLDITAPHETIKARVVETRHSYLPVAEGQLEEVLGVVRTRDYLAALRDGPVDPRSMIRPVELVREETAALDVVNILRKAQTPVVVVENIDQHFEGLVTPADLLETIAGAFVSDAGTAEPDATRRDDGSWLVSGSMPVDEAADLLGFEKPEDRRYATIAGYVLDRMGRLPERGEWIIAGSWRLEVVDMDGRRIDTLLALPMAGTHRAAGRPG
ncbi:MULTISPECIES: hemolysin family protein [unclassified Roseitalea]|uniref:hemolysin family protein n=1 Tax=unclassified Roseitalea TaxID=2639107 RepID=UPI0027400CD8|nr:MULTISPECIES: hemolysin family protein [unclassified Roseitalea]